MKLLLIIAAAIAAITGASVIPASPATSSAPIIETQDAKDGKAAPQDGKTAAQDAMSDAMKRYMENLKPGVNHAWLKQLIGKYDATMGIFMGGPKSKPMESKGTCEYRWLVQDRWLIREFNGMFMGKPMTQTSIIGFDSFKKKFVGSHVDSLSNSMFKFEGMLDQSRRNLIMYGTMDEPETGERDKPVKYVLRLGSDTEFTEEIHDLAIGETDTKVVEYHYTKSK